MNERIREIWDKAAESTAAYPSGQNNSWETQVNFMEKFAELIVQECIDIANLSNTHGNNQWDKALTFAVNTIKENFGVK